jgi:predicted O-methyltransferase YrrM
VSTALEVYYSNPKPVHRHADTWLTLEQTAVEKRFDMLYKATYDFPGQYIDGFQRYLAVAPIFAKDVAEGCIDIGFEGWLLPTDACKLYELAYFNPDVLEIGTYRGLSSAVMSYAITNSGRNGQIVTVDLDPKHQEIARQAHELRKVPNRQNIHYFPFDGAAFVRGLYERAEPRLFPFVFVDHTHVYEPMLEICPLLHKVTAPGGFVLFHDYNDQRNANPNAHDFGVYQAVNETLDMNEFEFYGVFGCCGLFRRRG